MDEDIPPIHVRLAIDRVDFNIPVQNENLPKFYTPGEEISNQSDVLRGHGTYIDENGVLRSSVAGILEPINKLISIRPYKNRYEGEIGDVVVGRVIEVQQKRWKVDINSKLDAVLKVSSVNLPGGELRRRSAEDEQSMRQYLQEGDVICAEVQTIFADGSLSLHTRVLKYGKLGQGMMLKVPPGLIKRSKTHYHNLENGACLILGCNGYIWIGANIQDSDRSEANFTENLSRVTNDDRIVCSRLRNCILCLVESKIFLSDTSVTYAYEESLKYEVNELILPENMLDLALLTYSRLSK